MMHPAQLPDLAGGGMAVGGHGAAHLPLSLLGDQEADLARCRAALGDGVTTLSFPHGRYDSTTVTLARQQGFATLFTSDAILNATPGGRASDLLGRINVDAANIAAPDGSLDPSRLATYLMNRPIRRL